MFDDNQSTAQDNPTVGDGLASVASTPQSPPVFGADPLVQTQSSESMGNVDMPTPVVEPTETTMNAEPSMTDDVMAPAVTEMPSTTQENEPVAYSSDDDLSTLKKEAISKLGPLLDKLDQAPIDKFKTTMMMIQATDDKSLVPKAYEAANAIEDEKLKAQALLDIVNEINYFTSVKN